MDGYHMSNPEAFTKLDCLDLHLAKPQLWRWTFNMKTGSTLEECLDKRFLEFGTWNQRYQGKAYRYVYSVLPRKGEFTFTGVTKTDVKNGESWTFELPADVY